MCSLLLVPAGLALMAASAAAQWLPQPQGVPRDPSTIGRPLVDAGSTRTAAQFPEANPWAPAFSAVIPGAGQALLDQDRFVAYMAVEGWALVRYTAHKTEGKRRRDEYRRLALEVARALFPGDKPIGDFQYYEAMERWVESGVFDMDPLSPVLEPELDPSTFNGNLWLLARTTFWENPDVEPPRDSPAYLNAERFYRQRAIRPEFQWSWRDAQLQHDLFRRSVSRSNEAFRNSILDLGVLLANHVLSTVDAYVTFRIRRAEEERNSLGIAAQLPLPRGL